LPADAGFLATPADDDDCPGNECPGGALLAAVAEADWPEGGLLAAPAGNECLLADVDGSFGGSGAVDFVESAMDGRRFTGSWAAGLLFTGSWAAGLLFTVMPVS